jgi:hypothetical protein
MRMVWYADDIDTGRVVVLRSGELGVLGYASILVSLVATLAGARRVEVQGCRWCPLYLELPVGPDPADPSVTHTDRWCDHPRDRTPLEGRLDLVPDACPLRTEPVLVGVALAEAVATAARDAVRARRVRAARAQIVASAEAIRAAAAANRPDLVELEAAKILRYALAGSNPVRPGPDADPRLATAPPSPETP